MLGEVQIMILVVDDTFIVIQFTFFWSAISVYTIFKIDIII